jgi:hypothetical protein
MMDGLHGQEEFRHREEKQLHAEGEELALKHVVSVAKGAVRSC